MTNLDGSSLSALTFQSTNPERLAAFYRDAVGLPLAPDQHGAIGTHYECDVQGIHFAVLKSSDRLGGPVVPVFRIGDLEAAAARVAALGATALHEPMDLGDGMRVVTFRDPEGNGFRMIEIKA
jgi:predicted enzyme related to lactoylglutathione lyase